MIYFYYVFLELSENLISHVNPYYVQRCKSILDVIEYRNIFMNNIEYALDITHYSPFYPNVSFNLKFFSIQIALYFRRENRGIDLPILLSFSSFHQLYPKYQTQINKNKSQFNDIL